MSDAPRTDEWHVTDTDTPEVFDKIRNETICGIYGGKTIGEQYDIAARIAKLPDLERELTAMTEQRDSIDLMYHKIIKEVLECDPIPACKREEDQLEPPWEVIARIREQRDALADALSFVLSCGYDGPLPEYARDKAQEALAAVKGENQ